MDDEKTKSLASKEEQKTFTAQEFALKYGQLCEEVGWRIVATPVWLARDDSTFSLQVQFSVGKLPKVELQGN